MLFADAKRNGCNITVIAGYGTGDVSPSPVNSHLNTRQSHACRPINYLYPESAKSRFGYLRRLGELKNPRPAVNRLAVHHCGETIIIPAGGDGGVR